MKLILLTSGGRSGSDFFHSLLDGHSQILQFPGQFRFNNNLKLIFKTKDLRKKANLFVKFYPEFFNSKFNKLERWNELGKNKNRFFKVNSKKFVNNFCKLSKKNNENSKNNYKFLINLHLAYFLARDKDIQNIKILFIHTHTISLTKKFIKFFEIKNFEIIHTIRHPLSAISSPIKSWLDFDKGKHFFSKNLFFHMNLDVNGIYDVSEIGKTYIIKLERLHKQNSNLMKKFCKKFKINFEPSLKNSTKNDLKWWSDSIGKKYLDGVNKNFKVKIYENHFYKRDLIFFQNITKQTLKKYNYNFYYKEKNILFNLLPMKCEIDVWKNTINNLFSGYFRWKHFLSIPLFYFLRVLKINKISTSLKNKSLPEEI